MSFYLTTILSLCIIVPALIGLIRFSKISEAFHPFIFCIWVGAVNEIYGTIIMYIQNSNIINLNIYLLIESLLLLWQFTRWGLFNKNSGWLKLIIASLLILWVAENFFIASINQYDSYFSIFKSTVITLMSISVINRLIVTERRSLLKNPVFIICSTFTVYYTITILSDVFWVYGINKNTIFTANVYYISVITNFISIILYTLAILWMPIKQRFSLPSS